jgi:hypothetical protein
MANPSPLDLTQLDFNVSGDTFDALQFAVTPYQDIGPTSGVTQNANGSYTVAANASFADLGYTGANDPYLGNDPADNDYTVTLSVTPVVGDPLYQYAITFYQNFSDQPSFVQDFYVAGFNADSILLANYDPNDPFYNGASYVILSDENIVTGDGTSGNLPSDLTFTSTGAAPFGLVAVACFAAGSRLRTPDGWRAVESLAVGDAVLTLRGAARPVRWIGQRAIDARRHPQLEGLRPVRVRAHAFGPGRPVRDLLLSPDHAVFTDGVLIPVRALVNGRSILHTRIDRVTYYHVELDTHDVVLAEDLPTESFLDTGNRSDFAGRVTQLRPDFAASVWDAQGCAPLVLTGPLVDAALARLDSHMPATRKRA